MAKKDDGLVLALAAGSTHAQAARKCGVSRATITRRLADPAFRQRVEKARGELWERSASVLAKTASEAAIVLRRLLQSDDEKVRLRAATAALEAGPRLRDQVELAATVRQLEEVVGKRRGER